MILFRPVGLNELALVYRTGMRAFPPRLPEQPIFYPVLNREYAEEIARQWNTKSESMAGYVTQFEIDDEYGSQFEPQQVGTRVHRELWVPAESLGEFNTHIVGSIRLKAAHFGPEFVGSVPTQFLLRAKNAREQLEQLAAIREYSGMDFSCEIAANHEAVFVNFPFWQSQPRAAKLLEGIRQTWSRHFPNLPLGLD